MNRIDVIISAIDNLTAPVFRMVDEATRVASQA